MCNKITGNMLLSKLYQLYKPVKEKIIRALIIFIIIIDI